MKFAAADCLIPGSYSGRPFTFLDRARPRSVTPALHLQPGESFMRFNPKALILFVALCLLIVAATSSGGGWLHVAEAATSALILFSVAGMFRDRRRAR